MKTRYEFLWNSDNSEASDMETNQKYDVATVEVKIESDGESEDVLVMYLYLEGEEND